jgi:hypothetical protein
LDELGFAVAFHELEGTILEACQDVSVEVTDRYLSDGSKKVEEAQCRESGEDHGIKESPYPFESKFGTVIAESHRLVSGRTTSYDTDNDFSIKTSPREKLYSCRFSELLLLPW